MTTHQIAVSPRPHMSAHPFTVTATRRPVCRWLGAMIAIASSVAPVVVAAAADYHSSDTDQNSRISLTELTRVIELYNTRLGTVRTGRYMVQAGTEDGFAPDPLSTDNQTLSTYHSADSNHNGQIALAELTRVIEHYNYRNGTTRTGEYHAQTGTEDGFAPGPPGKTPQTITFTGDFNNKTADSLPFSITATTSSGLPVTLRRLSGPGILVPDATPGVCWVCPKPPASAQTETLVIEAVQAGDATYQAASQTLTIEIGVGSGNPLGLSQSIWRDVNGGGVDDKIIRCNTSDCRISFTGTVNSDEPQAYQLNRYFEWRNLKDGSSGTLGEGFSWVWSPPAEALGLFTASGDIEISFEPESGFDYVIYSHSPSSGQYEDDLAAWSSGDINDLTRYNTGNLASGQSVLLPNVRLSDMLNGAFYLIRLGKPAPVITSASTASGTFGEAFTYTITASNSPTSFSASGLPSGLTLDSGTGVISGTPPQAGTFYVALSATNAGGTSPSVTLALTIAKATPVGTFADHKFTNPTAGVTITADMLNATFAHPSNPGVSQPSLPPTYAMTQNGSGNPVGATLYYGTYPITITATYPGDANYASATVSAIFSVEDTLRPSAPTGLRKGLVDTNSFFLAWNASTDNAGIDSYQVSVNNGARLIVTDSSSLTTIVGNLASGTAYTVQIRAKDWPAGNWSDWSAPLTVTTASTVTSGADQSIWMDLDGDGIRDEIIRPGTGRFSYAIDDWSTTITSYWDYPVNDYFLWYDFYSGDDNYGTVPGFSLRWDPYPFWNYYSGEQTDICPAFVFSTEDGYDYSIYQNYPPSSGHPQGTWAALVHFGVFVGGGIHAYYPGWYDQSFLYQAQFFLVRHSRPVGSVQLMDSAGAMLVDNLAVDGTADLFLPSNGVVTLNLRDTLNNGVGAGHQIGWQLLDPLGNVIRSGAGDNVNFANLSLGKWLLRIFLDWALGRTVTVNTAVVQQVQFAEALNLLEWNDNFADIAPQGQLGVCLSPKGWKLDGPNNPVALIKGTQPKLDVTVVVKPAGKSFQLKGYCNALGLVFTGGDESAIGTPQVVHVQANSALPATVGILEEEFSWSVVIDGQELQVNRSGPHKMLVTWDIPQPNSGLTLKRLEWLCGKAQGATSPQMIATKLYDAVASQAQFSVGEAFESNQGWMLLDPNTPADCDNIAGCMVVAFKLLGAGDAQVQKVIASDTAGAGNCLSTTSRPVRSRTASDGRTEYLMLYFPDVAPSVSFNAFEGCCVAAENYHAMGIETSRITATDDYQMLRSLAKTEGEGGIGVRQYWARTVDNIIPGGPIKAIVESYSEEIIPIP